MSDDSKLAGAVQLWHPRGVRASLPLAGDARAMLAGVDEYLAAGWLAQAPGLEAGEDRDEVSHVLRGEHERDGEATPYLLLYSANEALAFSFLKVYLNRPEDVTAFEDACGVSLVSLPLYVGNDKPERGKSRKTDEYIVKLPRPAGVVFKANPKWNEQDKKAADARGEVYKTPRRLFVRWDAPSQAPQQAPQQQAPAQQGPREPDRPQPSSADYRVTYTARFSEVKGAEALEKVKADVKSLVEAGKITPADRAVLAERYREAEARLAQKQSNGTPAHAGRR
jgi:hypothetical protein